jgi:hypothetical protein
VKLTKVSKILTGKIPQNFWISKNFKENPMVGKLIYIYVKFLWVSFFPFFFKNTHTHTLSLKLLGTSRYHLSLFVEGGGEGSFTCVFAMLLY